MSEHTCMSNFVLNKLVKYMSFKDILMQVDFRNVERVAVAVHLSLYENSRQIKLNFSIHRISMMYYESIYVNKKLSCFPFSLYTCIYLLHSQMCLTCLRTIIPFNVMATFFHKN